MSSLKSRSDYGGSNIFSSFENQSTRPTQHTVRLRKARTSLKPLPNQKSAEKNKENEGKQLHRPSWSMSNSLINNPVQLSLKQAGKSLLSEKAQSMGLKLSTKSTARKQNLTRISSKSHIQSSDGSTKNKNTSKMISDIE